MTFRELLRRFEDVPDRERLLTGIMHWTYGALLLHEDEEADPETVERFLQGVRRLRAHEPLQYVLGEAPFYGRMFLVDERVLIPRFDTEILVAEALRILRDIEKKDRRTLRVLDLCTGSGCIGLTLRLEAPDISLDASDLKRDALAVAKKNEERLLPGNDGIRWIQSDLFREITDTYDLIVTNPPYIKSGDIPTLDPEVRDHEPVGALSGGEDGLRFIRRIAKEAPSHLSEDGRILVEIGDEEGADALKIFEENGWRKISVLKDLAGRDRVLSAHKG